MKSVDAVKRKVRQLILAVAVFSALINLLALAGPLYMMQIYDRVLSSNGIETLVALSILLAACYLLSGFLDFSRTGLMARVAQRFDKTIALPAFDLTLTSGQNSSAASSLQDLRIVRKFIASPAIAAVFDGMWTPIFLLIIFLIHPVLGSVAVAGGVVLMVLAVINQRRNAEPLRKAEETAREADMLIAGYARNIDAAKAMGMRDALRLRWANVYRRSLDAGRVGADGIGAFSSATKALRLALQSSILGVGAYLAILQEITPGVMIASSILVGRALAPIDQGIAQWPAFVSARAAWARLKKGLESADVQDSRRTELPAARGVLSAHDVAVYAPSDLASAGLRSDAAGQPIIDGVRFEIKPGDVLAVVGPSASGKSTLAKSLAGAWAVGHGAIRLDGAELGTLSDAYRGSQIGFLPQDVELFEGTVAENIARLAKNIDSDKVVSAAIDAGAHDMILRLSDGYETQVGVGGRFLSGGQRQRIGLARALFGTPPLVILDEPNANLDVAGETALSEAIEARKAKDLTTVIVTHRHSSLDVVTKMLVMEGGRQKMFGDKDTVMARLSGAAAPGERKVTRLSVRGTKS
ncbi:MAG: type I secretion system permease/ATPase [Pseudomonadota bacterium]